MSRGRKGLVTLHVLGSTVSVGITAVMLVLTVAAFATASVEAVHMLRLCLVAVAIPALGLALVTGVTVALMTPWGLLRHTWVIKKLGLLLATGAFAMILLLPWVGDLVTAVETRADPGLTGWLVVGGLVAQLVKLVLITALSVYKPRGRVRASVLVNA
ncbi:hypothetical protein [Actinokineospora enzanensis]|uniref:hypothetical protein n=1 Tax=Actinokineospora enzanensis TaxID=155975 RepID=UPI000362481C|nr:hypothetical protein [Actinokineospora enzanensis]